MNPATTPPETEVLPANECWELLRTTSIGRLGVIIDDHPDIFPVNYKVDHGAVVFRVGEGTKLTALKDREQVAFEVDGLAENNTGCGASCSRASANYCKRLKICSTR